MSPRQQQQQHPGNLFQAGMQRAQRPVYPPLANACSRFHPPFASLANFCKRSGAKAEGQTLVEPPGNQDDGWGEGWGESEHGQNTPVHETCSFMLGKGEGWCVTTAGFNQQRAATASVIIITLFM